MPQLRSIDSALHYTELLFLLLNIKKLLISPHPRLYGLDIAGIHNVDPPIYKTSVGPICKTSIRVICKLRLVRSVTRNSSDLQTSIRVICKTSISSICNTLIRVICKLRLVQAVEPRFGQPVQARSSNL